MTETQFFTIIGALGATIVTMAGYIVALHKWKSKDAVKYSERIEEILIERNAKTEALLIEQIKSQVELSLVVKNNTEVLNIVKYKL